MGPALLPTPLSPAVGSRRNAYRLTFRALAPKGLRRSIARRSRRCRFRRGAGYDPKIDPWPPGGSETDRRAWLLERPCLSEDLQFLETGPVRPAFRLRALAVSTLRELTDPKIPRFPLLHPAASRRRVEIGSKISSFFRVLPRPSEEPIPALDGLKMRWTSESGKRPKPELSTFKPNSGGQGWITLPFVAHSLSFTLPVRLERSREASRGVSRLRSTRTEKGGGYLSRLARSLSRNALSLMKPSASCWS